MVWTGPQKQMDVKLLQLQSRELSEVAIGTNSGTGGKTLFLGHGGHQPLAAKMMLCW